MPPGTARVYSPGVRSAPVPKWTPQELEAMKSPGVSGQPPAAPEPSRLERQLSASIEQAKQSKLAPGATQPPPQLREGPGGDLPTVRPHRATQPETPPITPGLHELQVRPGATAEMVKNPMTQSALEYFEQLKNIHNRGFTRGGKV